MLRPVHYPKIEEHEFEVRCGICLRGMCINVKVIPMKTRDMYGVFVRPCLKCADGIRAGKTIAELRRWTDRQMDVVEGGEYEGMGWWNFPGSSS